MHRVTSFQVLWECAHPRCDFYRWEVLSNRPVLGLAEFLELARRRNHDPRGVFVLAVLAQRGADPQPGACPVPAAEPLVVGEPRVAPRGRRCSWPVISPTTVSDSSICATRRGMSRSLNMARARR